MGFYISNPNEQSLTALVPSRVFPKFCLGRYKLSIEENEDWHNWHHTVDGCNPANQLIGSLSHYL